jgi:hypothetical protein
MLLIEVVEKRMDLCSTENKTDANEVRSHKLRVRNSVFFFLARANFLVVLVCASVSVCLCAFVCARHSLSSEIANRVCRIPPNMRSRQRIGWRMSRTPQRPDRIDPIADCITLIFLALA